MKPTRLVLADDHAVVREGLRALLATEPDLSVVGEAADGLEAVELVARLSPDVLVVDLMMAGLSGLEVIREVGRRSPHTRVVVLSMYSAEAYVLEALRHGAAGFVLKECRGAELVQAVREVAAGRRYLCPPLSQRAIDAYCEAAKADPLDPYETLTAREREVFQMTAEGQSSARVGGRLGISPRTVETHRANAMRKLGLRTQTDLLRYALRRGILPVEPDLPRGPGPGAPGEAR